MAAPMTDIFQQWLSTKLQAISSEVDLDIFVPYLMGILEETDTDEEEMKESILGFLAEIAVSCATQASLHFLFRSILFTHVRLCHHGSFLLHLVSQNSKLFISPSFSRKATWMNIVLLSYTNGANITQVETLKRNRKVPPVPSI